MASSHAVGTGWEDVVVLAAAESPPRRRMVRALRQHVDLQIVRPAVDDDLVELSCYDGAGRTTRAPGRTGRLLDVRV